MLRDGVGKGEGKLLSDLTVSRKENEPKGEWDKSMGQNHDHGQQMVNCCQGQDLEWLSRAVLGLL